MDNKSQIIVAHLPRRLPCCIAFVMGFLRAGHAGQPDAHRQAHSRVSTDQGGAQVALPSLQPRPPARMSETLHMIGVASIAETRNETL